MHLVAFVRVSPPHRLLLLPSTSFTFFIIHFIKISMENSRRLGSCLLLLLLPKNAAYVDNVIEIIITNNRTEKQLKRMELNLCNALSMISAE